MADRATGKVIRIYAKSDTNLTLFRLALTNPAQKPGGSDATVGNGRNGYFYLVPDEPNYNALYSLLLVAATNGRNLQAKVVGEIKPWISESEPGENAHVAYLVVNWD